MPIVYVSNGAWGTGQGAPLTAPQHDTNIFTLATGIETLETEVDAIISVENITSSGNIVTFHLTNDTTIDIAFEVPAFNYRGTWLNSTAYVVGDIVEAANLGVYMVLIPHTSPPFPAVFDPDAVEEVTDGEPLYGLLLPVTDLSALMKWRGEFPAETTIDQYDVFSSPSFGVFLANSTHTSAVTFDPNAVDEEDAALYTQIAPPPFAPVEVITDTDYLVGPLDVGKYLRFTDPAGCAISFDPTIAVNSEIHLEQAGAGSLTFDETTDITIIPQRADHDTASPYEGATITAKVVAEATIKLIGPHGEEIT